MSIERPQVGRTIKGYDKVAYDWYPLVEGVELDGWRLGLITRSLLDPGSHGEEPDTAGDAFVIAPDNTRAGIVWTQGEPARFADIGGIHAEGRRFGVFSVVTVGAPTTRQNAASFLAEILPGVQEAWRRRVGPSGDIRER